MNSYVFGSTKKLIGLLFFIAAYLSFGALIFMVLEGEMEQEVRADIRTKVNNFLKDHDCVTGKNALLYCCNNHVSVRAS